MTNPIKPSGPKEDFAEDIFSSFIESLDSSKLVDITKIPASSRGAQTSILEHLQNKEVANLLSEFNGIENLGKIIWDTLYLTKGKDDCGRTILHYAASRGDVAMTKLIIHFAPDLINAQDEDGRSPIFEAIASGHYGVARWLVDPDILTQSNKANLSIVEKTACASPLHSAILRGRREIALLLKAFGANRDAKDKYGLTPGDLARRQYYSFDVRSGIPLQESDPVKAALFLQMEKEFGPTKGKLLSIEKIAELMDMQRLTPPSSWKKV